MRHSRGLCVLALLALLLAAPLAVRSEEPSTLFRLMADNDAVPTASVLQEDGQAKYQVFHLEFVDEASAQGFAPPGSHVFNRFQRWVDAWVEPTQAARAALVRAPGLRWLEPGAVVTLPPPPQLVEVSARAETEAIIRGGLDGLTGRGVALAVVDTGVDFRHPDFVTTDAQGQPVSRFLYVWDTTGSRNPAGSEAPLKYPDGNSVGTLYTREQLTADLRAASPRIPLLDTQGHGTACAGVAGGNGRALEGRYAGVAPGVDLIGVRLGDSVQNTYLFGALCAWLDRAAGARPLVVSNSWGSQFGGHDGSRLVERQIDARFPADRGGRCVLFAAGNEGDEPIHARVSYGSADQAGRMRFANPPGLPRAALMVYFESDDSSLALEPPLEKLDYVHPITGQRVWEVTLPGTVGEVKVYSGAGRAGVAHAYVLGRTADGSAAFAPESVSYSTLVGSPGTARNVVTVASYDWNALFDHQGKTLLLGVGPEFSVPMVVGGLSAYSSPGWARDGHSKPDIAAPGQWYAAPAVLGPVKCIRDTSEKYRLFNGTSAATPYCAGVVALMMEKRPGLATADLFKLFDTHATSDLATGRVPNPKWGRGKLDLAAVRRMLQAL